MFLAFIFATCLLPYASIIPSVHAMATLQSGQAQEQTSSSSPQSSPAQPPADQPAVHDQSTPPQPPTTPPCPEKTQPGSTARPDCKPAEPTGAKTRKHRKSHKTIPPADAPADAGPTQKVVKNGGAADLVVDLSPLSLQQASQQKKSTDELLGASDANLEKMTGRQLSSNQLDTVKEVKSYLEQARKALSDGDVQRAHNLAVKANLLSAELVAHRDE